MLPGYIAKTNIGVGVGVLLHVAAFFLLDPMKLNQPKEPPVVTTPTGKVVPGRPRVDSMFEPGAKENFSWAVGALGSVLFLWGCCCYAVGKGYHGAAGLLALFHLPGFLILVCLPDRVPAGEVFRRPGDVRPFSLPAEFAPPAG